MASQTANPDEPTAAAPRGVRMGLKTWVYTINATIQRFLRNQGTDMAATLTYYMVLAIFPALLSLVSLLKLSGIGDVLVPKLTELIVQTSVDDSLTEILVGIIEGFFSSSGAGVALAVGVLAAAWAASGYVAAFCRAMNRTYRVLEGRNPIRLKVQQVALTILMLVSMAVFGLALVVSGNIADWIAGQFDALSGAVLLWDRLRWPVTITLLMILIDVLYYFSPNVQFPRFRPLSFGSILAALAGLIAVVGFSFYASNFGSYDATYGALAGVIITLWLIWLTNLALIAGAHLDLEVLRTRQLLRGLPAEREPVLPPKNAKGVAKKTRKDNTVAAKGNQLRTGRE